MRFPVLAFAAVLAASSAAHAVQKAAEKPAQWTTFSCADGLMLKARFALGMVQVRLSDGLLLTLPRALSASGARYADDTAELWNKGRDLMLTLPGAARRDCRVAE